MPKPRKAISPNTETSKSETWKIYSWNAKTSKYRESWIRYYHLIGYFPAPLKKKFIYFFKKKRRKIFEAPCVIKFDYTGYVSNPRKPESRISRSFKFWGFRESNSWFWVSMKRFLRIQLSTICDSVNRLSVFRNSVKRFSIIWIP